MTATPWVVDLAGSRFVLVRYNAKRWPEGLRCWMCGNAIRRGTGCYRSTTWGSDHTETAHMHQRCCIGQIDPTVWDIPDGGAR